jgi:hypothetical protein
VQGRGNPYRIYRANLEKTNAIEAKARQEADDREQARELINKAQELRKRIAYEETSKIKSEVYQTDELKHNGRKPRNYGREMMKYFNQRNPSLNG